MPLSNACFSSGKASCSSRIHSCHAEDPNPAVPRITLDMYRPELPNLDSVQALAM